MRSSATRFLTLVFALGVVSSAFAQNTLGKTTIHSLKKIGTAHLGGGPLYNATTRVRVQPDHDDLVSVRRESIVKNLLATANAAGASLSGRTAICS